jgi:general secretion pathway protein D
MRHEIHNWILGTVLCVGGHCSFGAVVETNGLWLSFQGAPLSQVARHFAEAAGYDMVFEAEPSGKVDIRTTQPVTRSEALDLLDSILAGRGYTALRKNRTLTVVNRDEAKTRSLPVRLGSEPEDMPDTAEVVTQILPVRFVQVAEVLSSLQPLVSTHTTLTANESANTLVATGLQGEIRRLARVIQALDSEAEDFTVIRVFRLRNADAQEMSDLLTSAFPDESRSQGSAAAAPFGGGPGGGGGSEGGPGRGSAAATPSAASQKIRKRSGVTAVADARTASIVVSAPRDLMSQVEGLVRELDASSAGKQQVAVFDLKHARPAELQQVMQDLFAKSGQSSTRQTSTDLLQTRSSTQSQQNTSASSRGTTGSGASGGAGAGSGGGTGQQ